MKMASMITEIQLAKNQFTRAAHTVLSFFAVVLHDYNCLLFIVLFAIS